MVFLHKLPRMNLENQCFADFPNYIWLNFAFRPERIMGSHDFIISCGIGYLYHGLKIIYWLQILNKYVCYNRKFCCKYRYFFW